MNYPRHHHQRRRPPHQPGRIPFQKEPEREDSSNTESSYLKSLIDSHTPVTVTMKTGEQFRGHIRYYDQDCFSVGLHPGKRKLFLRKENVSHISED